jgi:hypothetical protein
MARTTFSGPVASDNGFITTITDTSTGSSTFNASTTTVTMTGAGGVGGRTLFQLNADAALGSFTNALKAITVYGASGSTSGLGSAFVAEMTLSAGTSAGTYAPLELELNAPASASTGTMTSFIYASTQGANVAVVDDNAVFFNLQGVTATWLLQVLRLVQLTVVSVFVWAMLTTGFPCTLLSQPNGANQRVPVEP